MEYTLEKVIENAIELTNFQRRESPRIYPWDESRFLKK